MSYSLIGYSQVSADYKKVVGRWKIFIKVGKLVAELCGRSISSTTVSEYAKLLDKEFLAFKERPLKAYKYLCRVI